MTSSSFRDAIMAMLLLLLENFCTSTLRSFLCGLKAETTQIFRAPEKLSEKELSLSFLVLTAMPLHGYLIGLVGWMPKLNMHIASDGESESIDAYGQVFIIVNCLLISLVSRPVSYF
ncbi:hypothetical protein GQ457_11G003270 [Hibiscus cannabinus]